MMKIDGSILLVIDGSKCYVSDATDVVLIATFKSSRLQFDNKGLDVPGMYQQ